MHAALRAMPRAGAPCMLPMQCHAVLRASLGLLHASSHARLTPQAAEKAETDLEAARKTVARLEQEYAAKQESANKASGTEASDELSC